MEMIIIALAILSIALACMYAASRVRVARLESDLAHEKQAAEEKVSLLNRAAEDLRESFKALSADALKSNNTTFLALAKENLEKFQANARGDLASRQKAVEGLVAPIRESLEKVKSEVNDMEKARREAYGKLTEQVKSLIGTQEKLETETGNLVKALRAPHVRGRWGEMQLRRVVELADMVPHCDFQEQQTLDGGDGGGRLRPDMIVRLPGGKNVVVDAKAPLDAYLSATEAEDEDTSRRFLRNHASQIRAHMTQLASKAYWEQCPDAPEFVVMFLPGESLFSAALAEDPSLIEQGGRHVIPATPTTLIALLRAVAYGWQQEKVAESVQEVSKLGEELYDRIRKLADHFGAMGKALGGAVDSYNKAVGSYETRVLVSAKRFSDYGIASGKEIGDISPIDKTPRALKSAEAQTPEEDLAPEGDPVPEGDAASG